MKIVKNSRYYNSLIKRVIDESEASTWDGAVREWEIIGFEEDKSLQASCICGKEKLRYLFTIRNIKNENLLFPIGSSCIRKFERDDLSSDVLIKVQLFKLFQAIENNHYIALSSDYFSRKILLYLYEKGAFPPNEHNNYNPKVDYSFLRKMFDKRDKGSITENQTKKIRVIIINAIKPFLREELKKLKANSYTSST